MSNREGCPTLTEEGKELLENDIKRAVTKFAVYGAKKDTPAEAQELLGLIANKNVTAEMLERFIVVDKRPIAGFFDVDKKLTYMFQIAYTDVKEDLRGKIAIYGVALLSENNKLITVYPDDGIVLDGEQANYRGTIKIHSIVGKPGTVVYYTGEYITREEYEAAKVPMVEKVLAETDKRIKPIIDQTINNFESQSTQQLATQRQDFEDFKSSAQRQLEIIQSQATADLAGIQEFVVKLVQMARLEGYFDQSLHILENTFARFSKKIDLLFDFYSRLEEELSEIGQVVFFPRKIPDDYILFNAWYPKSEFLLFIKRLKIIGVPRARIEEDGEGNFRFSYKINKETGNTNFFYARASLNKDDLNIYDSQKQSLPNPYKIENENHDDLKAEWLSTALIWKDDCYPVALAYCDSPLEKDWVKWRVISITGGVKYEKWNRGDSDRLFSRYTMKYSLNIGKAIKVLEDNFSETYKKDPEAEVHPAHITYIAGIKAKLSFDPKKELDKILDEVRYVY